MTWSFSGKINKVVEFSGDCQYQEDAFREFNHYLRAYIVDLSDSDTVEFKLTYKPKKVKQ